MSSLLIILRVSVEGHNHICRVSYTHVQRPFVRKSGFHVITNPKLWSGGDFKFIQIFLDGGGPELYFPAKRQV